MSTVDLELQGILRCPVSGNRLRRMTTEELGALNGSILAGDATYLDGRQARETLSSGLVTEDGRHAYREDDGILFLSMPWAIPVYRAASDVVTLDEVTESVRDFYDDVGWTRLEGGPFADAADFEDLRPVSRRYIHECHVRLSRYLDRGGRYLLDAGSGPIQYPEYLAYSEGYRTRICLDISVSALREAQKTLQERGIFILGDISRLPLADSSVDGVVSLHTIYHLAKDRQEAAIREIYRVLAPGRRAAIVYQWKDSSLNRVLMAPVAVKRLVGRILRRTGVRRTGTSRGQPGLTPGKRLFAEPQPYRWFVNRPWGFEYQISVWRTVSVDVLRLYVYDSLLGRSLLRALFALEERFPLLCGRIGQYAVISIHKLTAPQASAAC